MTEGMCYKFQSAPKYVTFESPQALRASVPTPFGPSGHFPLTGGIGPLRPRGAFGVCNQIMLGCQQSGVSRPIMVTMVGATLARP